MEPVGRLGRADGVGAARDGERRGERETELAAQPPHLRDGERLRVDTDVVEEAAALRLAANRAAVAAAQLEVDEARRPRRRRRRPDEGAVDVEVDAVLQDVRDVEVVRRVAVGDARGGDERRRRLLAGEDDGSGLGAAPQQDGVVVAVLEVNHDAVRLRAQRGDDGDGGVMSGREDSGQVAVGGELRGVERLAAGGRDIGRRSLGGRLDGPGPRVGEAVAVERQAHRGDEARHVGVRREGGRTGQKAQQNGENTLHVHTGHVRILSRYFLPASI